MTAPSDAVLLGVDVGTSGVKGVAIDGAGRGEVVASATHALAMQTPRPGWAEQHPDAWWEGACAVLRELAARVGASRVAGIGLSGQMHSSVFLDATGNVVRPALLWCDGRTSHECAELSSAIGEARLREWTCNPALEGFTLPKLLWLRRHEPARFARVATVLLPKDFVRYRLTGVLASEPSDASGTLMYDVCRDRWSQSLLDAVRIDPSLLPPIGGSAEILGRVTASAAALLGLREGTPVVGGGADNACGALSVGAVAPGGGVASWGTSGTVLAPTARPVVDPALRAHTFRHAAPGLWYVMGVVLSAGAAFGWFREQLARDLADAPDARQRLDDEAARIAPGADGLTFLPYLQGERTPHRDAQARGALVGLTLAHTRGHVLRAILEGVSFALRDSLTILGELELAPETLLLTGGGGRSAFLRQLQADVYGVPVAVPTRDEGGGPAYGAALLAGVGVGAWRDVRAACRACVTHGEVQRPAPGAHAAYDAPYRRYRSLYPAMRGAR